MNDINIFEKDGSYGILSLAASDNKHTIGHYNTLNNVLLKRHYEEEDESIQELKKSIQVMLSEGWNYVYAGDRTEKS